MDILKHSYSLLLISNSEKFNSAIAPLLQNPYFSFVHTVSSISAAKRSLLERAYDFVIINCPLSDEFGSKLAIDVCQDSNCVALLFVKNELYHDIYYKVMDYGVFVLPKPTSGIVVDRALEWMCSMRERMRRLEKKTLTVEEKMGEIRLVNRAKWILIEQLKMTEADAHRFIEKQAMDRCVSKKEIANNIIKTYS